MTLYNTFYASQKNKSSDKQFVILLGAFRGGTSFTSEIFNANPHVNYLFEPLFHSLVDDFYNQGNMQILKQKVVKLI